MMRRNHRFLALLLVVIGCVPLAGQTARVAFDGINLRQKPTADSAIVATVKKGAELQILEKVGTWYRVRIEPSGPEGYINSIVVDVQGPEKIAPKTPSVAPPPKAARPASTDLRSGAASAPSNPSPVPSSTLPAKALPIFKPGAKPRLVIKTLDNPSTSANSTIGNAVTDLFVTELGKTGRFTLLGPDGRDPELVLTGKVTSFSFQEHSIQREVATPRGAVLQTMYQQDATVRVDFNIANKATDVYVLTDSGIATQSHVSATSEQATYNRLVQVGVSSAEGQDSMMGRTTIEAVKNAIRKINDLASGLSTSSSGSSGGAAGLVRAADRYMEDDHFSQAVDAYEKALSAEPNSFDVMGKLLSAYLYNKQLSDAEDLSERLIANHGQISMRAVHNHTFGSCEGQLVITSENVSYVPKKGDDKFSWKASDIIAIEQGTMSMWSEGRMPSLVVQARDAKGKDKRYDFLVTAYFVSNPGSMIQKARDPDALSDTEKLHRILIRLIKQVK